MGLITSGQITVTDVTDGYSVVLSPNNYTFQGTTDSVSGTQSVTATASATRGTTAVSASINAANIVAPSGFTITNAGGAIGPSIVITANNSVTGNGDFTVPVTVNDNGTNVNFNLKFSYSVAYTGSGGRGLDSIVDEYCLSTSDQEAIGQWHDSLPAYMENRYYWVRQHITYSDGTEEYTTAVYDGALTSSNGNAYNAYQAAQAAQAQAGRAETAADAAVAQAGRAESAADSAVSQAGRAESAANTAAQNAAQAISDAANAAQAASDAQDSADAAAEAAQAADDKAVAAGNAASTAQTSANNAASAAAEADRKAVAAGEAAQAAQDSADIAQDAANDAIGAANVADGKAVAAYNAAQAAQDSADDAQDAADAAQSSADEAERKAIAAGTAASQAQQSANQALESAGTANRAANGALTQLSTIEDVMDVLTWIQDHGTYVASTDTEVVPGKYYFTRTGTDPEYSYHFVTNPTGNPSTSGYYECSGVDEAVSNYVASHLAMTNDGLYIVMDNLGYKLKLAADGAYVIDPTGQTVATYGENIFFDSNRPQRIGNNNVYIEYYDSDHDTVADALRIVGAAITLSSGRTVEQTVSDLQNQIDGAVKNWFYSGDPSLSTPPVTAEQGVADTGWDTVAKKNQHLGDVYYNNDNGHAFRWQLSEGVYSWEPIPDTDVVKAIEDAKAAMDAAEAVGDDLDGYKTIVSSTYATNASLTQTENSIKQEVASTYTTTTAFNNYKNTNDAAVQGAVSTANQAATNASAAATQASNAATAAANSETAAQNAQQAAQNLKDRADAGEFDGASITVTATQYQEGSSNTVAPTGTWSSSPVSVAEGKYLWTKISYSDGTYSYSVAKQGTSGRDGTSPTVTGTTVEYKQSTDGSTPPTGDWSPNPPTAIQGQYMWVRSTVSYSDGKTSASYSVSKNGADGASVSVTKTEYQSGTSNTSAPTGSWSTTPVSVAEGNYLWTKVTYSDGNVAYSVAKQGASGVSISNVTNHYLATDASSGVTKQTSGWTTSIQTITQAKPYLWNYETVTGSNNSTISETAPVIIGRYGQDGVAGKGIRSITEHYQVSSSNTQAPTSWSETMVNTTETNKYLWNYETVTYTDNTTEDSTKRVIGTHGEAGTSVTVTATEYQAGASSSTAPTGNWSSTPVTVSEGSYLWTRVTFSDGSVSYSVAKQGVNGVSIASVINYYLATSASSGVTRSTSGWTTTIQTMDATKQYLWNYEVTKGNNNATITTTDPVIIGRYGKDGAAGKGIKSITEHYQVSSSNTTPPTTWSDTMVNTTTTDKYLWNYETITYTDDSTSDSTKRVIGTHGATGTSVSVSKTEYQAGTSSTTAPTGTWSTTPVSVVEGNYLWTKVTYSDGSYSYSVAKQGRSGTNGTSPTVTSTTLDYQRSTSGTAIPTGNWSSTPLAPTTTEYVWTRSTTTYSDGATATSYSVGGKVGEKGDTGKGISSVTAQYYVSTSKTTQTGGSWGETSPSWTSGKYLWIRNKIVYTNPSSTEYTTPWCDNSWEAANAVADDLATVKTTYVTNATFETKTDEIEASVEEVETTTKTYTDGKIATEVTNRNAAITAKANEINSVVATKVGNNEVISRINQTSESVTIDASKININGVITAGSLAKTSDLPTDVSDLNNDLGFQTASDVTTALSPYATSSSVASTYATRTEAVIQTQRIYKSAPSGTNSMTGTTTWITSVADTQNAWTTKRPTYDSNYPVLFTAIQKQTVSQYANNGTTCTCTTPVKDDTLTIIDGGHITTGTIDAARIAAHSISANHLAADAIKSTNYQASSSASSPYSSVGTYLNLNDGSFYTPNFGVDSSGHVYLNGEIIASSGKIGDSTANSYWDIGATWDYNQAMSAYMKAIGTAYIQIGDFQFSNGLLDTRSYDASNQITYPKDSNVYYDFGINSPTLTTLNHENYPQGVDNLGHDNNFIYIRKHASTIPSQTMDWNYIFRIDKDGMIWINGESLDQKYAAIGSGSAYVVKNGDSTITGSLTVTGSINGTATKATQLSNARTFIANLASTTAGSFDGLANVSLGVTGTLGVGNGGTGKASWTQYGLVYASTTSALSQLAVGTSGQVLTSGGNAAPGWTNQSSLAAGTATKWASPQTVYVTLGTASTTMAIQGGSSTAQTIGVDGTLAVGHGGTGATTFTSGAALIGNGTGAIQTRAIRNNTTQGALGWTSSSTDTTLITTNTLAYWNGAYRNTDSNLEYVKLGKLGTVVTHNIDEFITTAGGIIDGSLSVTDLTAGNLIVNGAGRFTNGLYGDLTGTATNVSNSLKIQLNGGTTEGTNQFTFNGSAAKTVNITKSSIGLGNVENTALSTWAGSSNLTTTKVGTLAAAAVKNVDTSIGAGSTSANLPTSAAVASFVEGKGYVTSSGVTSVRVQATSPVVSSSNTAQSSTLNTTISLADAYGDTKNPYGTKTANYVLAGPASGNAAAPGFRALVAADIPTLAASKVGLGNVTNNRQVVGLASGTTSGHFVTWGANGYTVADSGYTAGQVVKTLASNNDGKLVLTYLDGTTSDPIEVKIIGSSGSSVSYADALNVNGTAVGSSTVPIYLDAQGKPKTANTIPAVTLNGSANNTPSFYAATGAGTSGQYLKSNGSGAPTWATFSKSTVGLGNVDNTADANKNVLTATKFASAQSVTLTGDTTGTASSQAGWSIVTTSSKISPTELTTQDLNDLLTTKKTLYYYAAGSNNVKHNPLNASDTPSQNAGIQFGMVHYASAAGHITQEVSGFGNDSNHGKWIRWYNGSSWQAWEKFVTSSNYTSYTVTKTGSGASGSWGISVTGSSASCTGNAATATKATQDGNGANIDSTYAKLSGATFTGAINTANNTLNKIGDDCYLGDQNVGGCICIKGANAATGINFIPYSGSTSQKISIDGAGTMTITGTIASAFSGNLNGNATTATTATKATQDSDGNAINSTYLKLSGGTMTGQIKTSFKSSVAVGSYSSLATTIEALCGELRYSSGVMGSVNIQTAYTKDNITISAKWYNFLWVPHRTGGYNGTAAGDNCDYGSLYLSGMTGSGLYMIRFYSGAISEVKNLYNPPNAILAEKATADSDGNTISSTYAKLSGATFTGAVTAPYLIANTQITLSAGKVSGLATKTSRLYADALAISNPTTANDVGWIRVTGTSEADTVMEIATGDDGGAGEQIVVRQYNTSNAVARELKLFDTAGNTSIPGTVKIGNGVTLQFDSATSALNFVFA